jgi:hypothetical protein
LSAPLLQDAGVKNVLKWAEAAVLHCVAHMRMIYDDKIVTAGKVADRVRLEIFEGLP